MAKSGSQNDAMIVDLSGKSEAPFLTGSLGTNQDFWIRYMNARPHVPDSFFRQILDYHATHSEGGTALAHDIGTGPGNIAIRLVPFFDHVVGSDVNSSALAAAKAISAHEKLTFVESAAEQLSKSASLPPEFGPGKADLVLVSECIGLLDAPTALHSFHSLLRPGGTLAIYFYGGPIFVNSSAPADAALCQRLWDETSTHVYGLGLPFKGTPGYPFHRRAWECLESRLDSIALPPTAWADVERHKWNAERSLAFSDKSALDFEFEYIDRRTDGEKNVDNGTSLDFWADEWDADRSAACIASCHPGHDTKPGWDADQFGDMVEELRRALGGGNAKMKVTFPVVLIMATKRH